MTVKPGYYLVRMINGVEQRYFELKEGLTKIGRANTQDIRCPSLQVSREHCIIDLVGGHVLIRDLQSFNGTYVKSDKIPSLRTCALNEGDLIGLGADSDGPITEFVFKLVIINENNNGEENLPMSEAEAMLKSLKRKDSTDISTVPTAKKPRNTDEDCVIINETHNKPPVILCQTIKEKKQNAAELTNSKDVISINLVSDSESDEVKIILPIEKEGQDVETQQVKGSTNKITDNNCVEMQPSNMPNEETFVEQPSFSLNDEVILLSDCEEDEQASQLFSHIESTSLLASHDKVKIKNEVTENYEVRNHDYDDEDRPIEEDICGMFEEHFIHCSQEIQLRKSSNIPLETDFNTIQLDDKNRLVDKVNENLAEDSVKNDVCFQNNSSTEKDFSAVDHKENQRTIDCDKTAVKENAAKMTPAENQVEKQTVVRNSWENSSINEQDTLLPKESEPPLSNSYLEAKKTDKIKNNKRKTKEKENKSIICAKNFYGQDKFLDREGNNKSSNGPYITVNLEKIKPLNKTIPDVKTSVKKVESKKRVTKRNVKVKEAPIRCRPDMEKLRKERGEKLKMIALKAKEKAKSENEPNKQSTLENSKPVKSDEQQDSKPLVNDTVRVSNRTKTVPVSKVKLSAGSLPPKLKYIDQKTDSKISNKSDVNSIKPIDEKVNSLQDRSPANLIKPVDEKVNSLQDSSPANSIKPIDEKVNSLQDSAPTNFIKPVDEKTNTLQDSITTNHINENPNLHTTSENQETLVDRINRLKLWEQNIIRNVSRSSLDLSTNDKDFCKTRKTIVQFKADLVEIRNYICEGNFTRKVSDKENRTKREIPPRMPLMDYSWRMTLKTNPVLYDMCKWNVTWLEECKKIEGDPPVVKLPFLSVKDSYISYTDYWRTMYPLLMTELWCEVYNDLALQDKRYLPIRTFNGVVRSVIRNPPCVGLDNIVDGRRLISVDCVFVGYREECRRGLAPDEGDLGIMQVDIPGENKKRFNTFTFVSSEMKSVPYHHSNDHFAKFVVINMQSNTKEKGASDKTYSKVEPTTCLYGQLSFCDSPNKPVTEGSLLKLRVLRNLYKNLRIFDSLVHLPKSPLVNKILNPKCIIRPKSHRRISKQIVSNFPLNQSQIDIILEVSKDLLSGKPSISLIHGPPGTGKTRVIANLVLQIYSHITAKKSSKMPLKEKILLCAPSNAAIDSLVLRLMEIRQTLPSDKRFKLIRVGPPETIHRHVREIASQTLAAKEVGNTLDSENLKIDLRLLTAEETSLSYALENAKGNDVKRFTIELATIQEKKRNLERLTQNQGGSHSYQARAKLIREAETKVIQGAEIIATTLSSCYARKLIEAMGVHQHLRFSYCIVDEATQGIEQEVLLPLLHNISGIVLVGDPLQLAPTILSESGKKYNLGRSVFHRIWREWESEGNIADRPFYALNVQHRMHPEIAHFPNEEFYGGNLITPEFLNVRLPFLPYCVISHNYKQDPDGESNTLESELVVKLLIELNKSDEFQGLSVGVIVPYQRQKQIMEKAISNMNEEIGYIKVNTVDSYQGQEKDVIVFPCVRTEGIGFLSDRLRVNVALTRARKCLIVIANFSSLQMDKTWKSLCHNAKKRGLYREVSSSVTNLVDLLKPFPKRNK